MTQTSEILCIGSVLWDVIGRSASVMRQGSDVPGRITRLPGGVAMNIAMTLVRFGMTPTLLTAVGRDPEGDELVHACARLGMVTDHIYRSQDLPTDRYMAVEGANGLIAAIADAHSLEAAGAKIFGISKDSVASHAKFAKKRELTVGLLSDENGTVCEDYGVWKEKNMYGKKYMGIERTTYLIDASGNIAMTWPKVKVPGHAEAVLAAVQAL